MPFRGAYLQLRPERRELVRGLIYPVPDPRLPFLGIHLTPTIDGAVLIGPSALLATARDGYRPATLRAEDIRDTLAWPGTLAHGPALVADRPHRGPARRQPPRLHGRRRPLRPRGRARATSIAGPAGVRAQAVARDGRLVDDFLLSTTPRAIHVRNAPSPAATSALALAELIADRADELS